MEKWKLLYVQAIYTNALDFCHFLNRFHGYHSVAYFGVQNRSDGRSVFKSSYTIQRCDLPGITHGHDVHTMCMEMGI